MWAPHLEALTSAACKEDHFEILMDPVPMFITNKRTYVPKLQVHTALHGAGLAPTSTGISMYPAFVTLRAAVLALLTL